MLTENLSPKEIAREIIMSGTDTVDLTLAPEPEQIIQSAALMADLAIPFPPELAPRPQPLDPRPDPNTALNELDLGVDVLVVTWTVAELNALADVLTPNHSRTEWYRYTHRFNQHYVPLIKEGAPALAARRLGSWFLTDIGNLRALCFKSELHLNQDGITTAPGKATLPVRDLFEQLIAELNPKVVITVGTAGGVDVDQDLGDVVVTPKALFRLSDEFRLESFAHSSFESAWDGPIISDDFKQQAEQLMRRFEDRLVEPVFAPPTKRYEFDGEPLEPRTNQPSIALEERPILTTDSFEFGTSSNGMGDIGCSLEMGDAVLGMVAHDMDNPPRWVVVRNVSDPQINGDLPTEPRSLNMQAHWAVWYYEKYGYWTSVMSALATWAIIATLNDE